jgi:phospholipid/cholesterol/gamma-HCH transport system substrate-binding protein
MPRRDPELNGLLKDARATLQKVDAVLVEAQAVGANARVATQDLGACAARSTPACAR